MAESYWKAAAKGLHGGRRRPKRPKTIADEKSAWNHHIKAKLGQMRFAQIRRADIKSYMRWLATETELAPATIAKVGGVLSSILGFALHEDMLEANPAHGLTRPLAWDSRSRLFNDASLAVILKVLIEASSTEKLFEGRGTLTPVWARPWPWR